jgi:phage gp45-like
MVSIGKVTGVEFATNRDSDHPVRMLQVEFTDGEDIQNVEWMGSGGADYAPPVGSFVLVIDISGANRYAIASDDGTTPDGEDGSWSIYSVQDGQKKATLQLDTDGNIKLNGDARAASGVGDDVTISAEWLTWFGVVGGVVGTPPPTNPVIGQISSGEATVKLP